MAKTRASRATRPALKTRGREENLTNAGKGRRRGVPNKVTREIKAASRAILEEPAYVLSLKRRLKAGKAPLMEVLLHHYGYGKPTVHLEVKLRTVPKSVVFVVAQQAGAENHT